MAVPVQIESIIKRLANKSIKFIQPIYEAIANSLEANATKIVVELYHDDPFDGTVSPKIVGFKITDNGDGFTIDNREAFKEFWTPNKAKMGCKGSGRFLWLTVFNNIIVHSEVADEQVTVDIDFNRHFYPDKVITRQQSISCNHTVLEFKNVTNRYYDLENKVDYRVDANLEKISTSVKEYLLIKLFLLKNKDIEFSIIFRMDGLEFAIKNDDIPDLQLVKFSVPSSIGLLQQNHEFTLYYHFFADKKGVKKGFYCANDRAAQAMDENDLGFSGVLPNRDSFTILLSSDYFNDKDDDSRNGLSVLKGNKDRSLAIPLFFSDIRPVMQQKMKKIIKDKYPEIETINREAVEAAVNSAPHLASIIYADDDIVKTRDSLVKKAKAEFTEKKEQAQSKFLKLLHDKSIDEHSFIAAVNELSDIAAAELGEYIYYRDSIIKALDRAISDANTDEAFIHNIIMKMKTSSIAGDDNKYLLSICGYLMISL